VKCLRALAIVVAFGAAVIACDRIVILTPPPDGGGNDGGFVPDAAFFPDAGTLDGHDGG
jgi:hypothetical protein